MGIGLNTMHKAVIPDGLNPSYEFKKRTDLKKIKNMMPTDNIRYYKNFVYVNGECFNGVTKEDIDAILQENQLS